MKRIIGQNIDISKCYLSEIKFIVDNEWLDLKEAESYFKDWCVLDFHWKHSPLILISPNVDMYDVLVACGLFKSKGEAKKNWKKSGKEIPNGITEFSNLGKHRMISILIWKGFDHETGEDD